MSELFFCDPSSRVGGVECRGRRRPLLQFYRSKVVSSLFLVYALVLYCDVVCLAVFRRVAGDAVSKPARSAL